MEHQRIKTIGQMFDSIVQCMTDIGQSLSDTTTNEMDHPMSSIGDNSHYLGDDDDRDEDIDESQTRSLSIRDQKPFQTAHLAADPKISPGGIENESTSLAHEPCRPKQDKRSLQSYCGTPSPSTATASRECKSHYVLLNEEMSIATGSEPATERLSRSGSRRPEGSRLMRSFSSSLDRARSAAISLIQNVRSRSLSPRDKTASIGHLINNGKSLLTKSRKAFFKLTCLSPGEKSEESVYSDVDSARDGDKVITYETSPGKRLIENDGQTPLMKEQTKGKNEEDRRLSTNDVYFSRAAKMKSGDIEKVKDKPLKEVSSLSVSTLVGFFERMDQKHENIEERSCTKCCPTQQKREKYTTSAASLPDNYPTTMVLERLGPSDDIVPNTKLQSMSLREYLSSCSEESEELKSSLEDSEIPMAQGLDTCDQNAENNRQKLASGTNIGPEAVSCIKPQLDADKTDAQFLSNISQQKKLKSKPPEKMKILKNGEDLQTEDIVPPFHGNKTSLQPTENANSEPPKNFKPEEKENVKNIKSATLPSQLHFNESDVIWIDIERTVRQQRLQDFESKSFFNLRIISRHDDSNKTPPIRVDANEESDDKIDVSTSGQTSPKRELLHSATATNSDHFSFAPPPNSPRSGLLFEGKRVGTTISLFETRSALSNSEPIESDIDDGVHKTTASRSAEAQLISAECWCEMKSGDIGTVEEIEKMETSPKSRSNEEVKETTMGKDTPSCEIAIDGVKGPSEDGENRYVYSDSATESDKVVQSDYLGKERGFEEMNVGEKSDSLDNDREISMEDEVKDAINNPRPEPISLRLWAERGRECPILGDSSKTVHSGDDNTIINSPVNSVLDRESNLQQEHCYDSDSNIHTWNKFEPDDNDKPNCDDEDMINPEEGDSSKWNDGSTINTQPKIAIKQGQFWGERCTKKAPNFLVFSKIPEETETNEWVDLPSPPSNSPDSSSPSVEMPLKRCAFYEDLPSFTEKCTGRSENETLFTSVNPLVSLPPKAEGQGLESGVVFEGTSYINGHPSPVKDDSQMAIKHENLDQSVDDYDMPRTPPMITVDEFEDHEEDEKPANDRLKCYQSQENFLGKSNTEHCISARLSKETEFVNSSLLSVVQPWEIESHFIPRDRGQRQFSNCKSTESSLENQRQTEPEVVNDEDDMLQQKLSWNMRTDEGVTATIESAMKSGTAVDEKCCQPESTYYHNDFQGTSIFEKPSDIQFPAVNVVEAITSDGIDKRGKKYNPSSSFNYKSASEDEIRQIKSTSDLTERGRSDSPNSFVGEILEKIPIEGNNPRLRSPRCIRWDIQPMKDEPLSDPVSLSLDDEDSSSNDRSNSCTQTRENNCWQYKCADSHPHMKHSQTGADKESILIKAKKMEKDPPILPLQSVPATLDTVEVKAIAPLNNASNLDLETCAFEYGVKNIPEKQASPYHSTITKAEAGEKLIKMSLSADERTVNKSQALNKPNNDANVCRGQQKRFDHLEGMHGLSETCQVRESLKAPPEKRLRIRSISESPDYVPLTYLTYSQALRKERKMNDRYPATDASRHPGGISDLKNQTKSEIFSDTSASVVNGNRTTKLTSTWASFPPEDSFVMQRRLANEKDNFFLREKSKTLPVIPTNSDALREKIEASRRKITQTIDFVDRARRRIDQCEALIDKSMNTLRKSTEVSEKCRYHLEIVNRLLDQDQS